MKENYTHIVLLIDRSGSMIKIKNDMEGGIKTFLDNQKQLPGECTITVSQFDCEYETFIKRVPISDVKDIEIIPRGGTALIDAMCRLIIEVGDDLKSLDENERPDKILFVTITDGEENSSHEFTNEMLCEMIKEQEEKYSWNFTYIGANQDAFSVATKYGMRQNSSLNYGATSSGVNIMFSSLSDATYRYRMSKDTSTFSYTDEEQDKQQ